MGQTLVEKIAQKYAVDFPKHKLVKSGDYITIKPAHVMTHDNTGAVIPKFKSIGAAKIFSPRQVVFTLDHNVQDKSEKNLAKYEKIENFAEEMGVDFYPAGRGIGHQIMCEEGYAFPGTMAVASDSHSNMYGGLGCLGTPIVRTDAASVWATGRTWWQVPQIAKVNFIGKLQNGVTGKDVIITLCGYFNKDEVLNHAIEFVGDGISELSIDERLTIANMTTEWGALVGIFPIDEKTISWLKKRAEVVSKRGLEGVPSDSDGNGIHPRMNLQRIQDLEENPIFADSDSNYSKELVFDLSSVEPHVSGPNTVKLMTSVSEIQKKEIKIQKAYLVSCVNSRLSDIAEAAEIVKGKKVAEGVDFYVSSASSEVQAEAEEMGYWQTLIDSGAKTLPPGCGPCIGLGAGLLEDGEVGISATNRNFKGRMGSPNAEAYLASPAVVAHSAIEGKISYDFPFSGKKLKGEIKSVSKVISEKSETEILDGFSETLEGDLIFCYQNNLNTDGIYPGKYTYKDEMTAKEQAEVVMENYDLSFSSKVKEGDFLVGGFNFGTGSSREQAATALKYRGIKIVLAGSFSETYKRNALNNGFLVIEAPELVNDLLAKFGSKTLTVKTGIKAEINFKNSTLFVEGKNYSISSVGPAAQELILVGGLENWVKKIIC